ncbi:MAG: PDZ domain-containing protein [Acidobacteriota bacterium]|nr:PDZ domain-containing protein [Acidobacteriota bacterium]
MSEKPKYLNVFLLISGIAIVFGLFGLGDISKAPHSGLVIGPNNSVMKVAPESPAESAGLQEGDVVRSIGGIAVEDTKATVRRPRAEIGEIRTVVVERNGERLEFDVTYGAQPSRLRVVFVLSAVIALCFLGFCLWAYGAAPSPTTLILALFGLLFGLSFLPAPYSKSFMLRTLGGALVTVLIVMGFAVLVHFLLLFPKRRAFLDKPWAQRVLYGPAIAVNVLLLFFNLVQPDFTGGIKAVILVATGLFVVGYFGWALVLMVQSFVRASGAERSSHGLTLMLLGTLIGLLPVIASSLAIRLSVLLPGGQYYGLALGLIPITFALAAVRKYRATAPEATG